MKAAYINWASSGRMQTRPGRTLPLSEAATAHRLMESGSARGGKIVLIP